MTKECPRCKCRKYHITKKDNWICDNCRLTVPLWMRMDASRPFVNCEHYRAVMKDRQYVRQVQARFRGESRP